MEICFIVNPNYISIINSFLLLHPFFSWFTIFTTRILLNTNFDFIFSFFLASLYGKTKRKRWSDNEIPTVQELFAEYLVKPKGLPSAKIVQKAIHEHDTIKHITAVQIKTWINK